MGDVAWVYELGNGSLVAGDVGICCVSQEDAMKLYTGPENGMKMIYLILGRFISLRVLSDLLYLALLQTTE